MNKLRRQVIVLALCLAAVLWARFYVNKFLERQRGVEESGASETAEAPVASAAAPVDAGGVTVEMPAPAGGGEAEVSDEAPASGPIARSEGGG